MFSTHYYVLYHTVLYHGTSYSVTPQESWSKTKRALKHCFNTVIFIKNNVRFCTVLYHTVCHTHDTCNMYHVVSYNFYVYVVLYSIIRVVAKFATIVQYSNINVTIKF